MNHQSIERNLRYLVIEIFWAAIFTGCVSFNAAYMIRLGGSNMLISLMTAGAALINAIATMPFAALLERTVRRKPLIVGSLALVRLGHIALIFIPWLPGLRAETMLLLVLVLNIPVALFTAGWLPLLAEIIPLRRRARVFSSRNITLGITVTICTFIFGRWLDLAPFPFNYQLLYALAVVSSSLSTVYVARMVIPDSIVSAPAERPRLSPKLLREVIGTHRSFANIILNTLIFNIALWMAVPLQPIYFVRTLGASDGWLGLWLGLVSGGTILGNLIWTRLIDRRGAAWALVRTTALSSIYYFLIGAFPNLTLILLFALLAGLINPGVELSHLNVLFEVCPAERRATYMGVYITAMNVGAFVAPLAVAPLADLIGTQALVLALGALRLAGAALFTFNPVRVSRAQVSEAT
ncbi:MAG TPA: MFS transporter [Roseiflexaceae bacterium]|nr:MFS transporter [Roseiflexaceae bacterium]